MRSLKNSEVPIAIRHDKYITGPINLRDKADVRIQDAIEERSLCALNASCTSVLLVQIASANSMTLDMNHAQFHMYVLALQCCYSNMD